MKIKLTIEYDGGRFFGWQKQSGLVSIQETIEKAIEKVFNLSETIDLHGAGRTDTGVHAIGQVAHFSILDDGLAEKWKADILKLPIAINFYLIGIGVVVLSAEIVSETFHARFSAKMRHYRYVMHNHRIKSVIYENRAWHISRNLDESQMNEAAQSFLGTYNLNAFRSAHCNSENPIRTISKIEVFREERFVIMKVAARSFLHNQVRIMVGTLAEIGIGKRPVKWIEHILETQDRTKAGVTAPPFGLYFMAVDY
ncbi:MAG: tRNA pseudouridine(38-40) synthase TruA [Holosporales bacterium]|jgi:tRNA pseudouridine38-40 synthase|nr:tRNA pseudouridine(38-40) synthase TruA [Holosporales bacterium]